MRRRRGAPIRGGGRPGGPAGVSARAQAGRPARQRQYYCQGSMGSWGCSHHAGPMRHEAQAWCGGVARLCPGQA